MDTTISKEICDLYGVTREEMYRARDRCIELVKDPSLDTKGKTIDKLIEYYPMSREAAICAISLGHMM